MGRKASERKKPRGEVSFGTGVAWRFSLERKLAVVSARKIFRLFQNRVLIEEVNRAGKRTRCGFLGKLGAFLA
jgi:hypothetical protein